MMGLAVDPGFTTGQPYVYVLYAYNHVLGDAAAAPALAIGRRGQSAGQPDRRPLPEPAAGDDRRLRRLRPAVAADLVRWRHVRRRARPHRGLVPAVPEPLDRQPDVRPGRGPVRVGRRRRELQQRPRLRPVRRDAAGTPTPANPCGDPPGAAGDRAHAADGRGRLAAQPGLRTAGDPTGLDGTILRVDPDTGAGWPTNAQRRQRATPNARRIIAYGLRNPFRFTIRPGTDDVWLGDVGFPTWEEINRLAGPDRRAARTSAGRATRATASCRSSTNLGLRSVRRACTAGERDDARTSPTPLGIGRDRRRLRRPAARRSPGWPSCPSTSGYPGQLRQRACSSPTTPAAASGSCRPGPAGSPDVAARAPLRQPRTGRRAELDGGAVFLTTAPTGDLIYADYDLGEIRRIHYYGTTSRRSRFTATPAIGAGAARRRLRRQRPRATQRRPADLRLGPRRRRAVRRRHRRDEPRGPYAATGNVDRRTRVTDPAGRQRHDDPDDLRRATRRRRVDHRHAASVADLAGRRQSIAFSATATDPQDGTLPRVGLRLDDRHAALPVGLPHPHHHETFSGVKSGTVRRPRITSTRRTSASVDRHRLAWPDRDRHGRDLPEDRHRVGATSPARDPDDGRRSTGVAPATTGHRRFDDQRHRAGHRRSSARGSARSTSWSDGGARTSPTRSRSSPGATSR